MGCGCSERRFRRDRLAGAAVGLVARRYGGKPEVMETARAARASPGTSASPPRSGPSGYLVGDSFSVADLTAASILYHLAEPPEFQYVIPEFPDERVRVPRLPAAGEPGLDPADVARAPAGVGRGRGGLRLAPCRRQLAAQHTQGRR